MNAPNQQRSHRREDIPLPLQAKFDTLRRQLEGTKRREWLVLGLAGYLLCFLGFFFVDRLFLFSWPTGVFFWVAAWSGLLLIGPLRYFQYMRRHRTDPELATLLRQSSPHYGDRLLGVLELQNQQGAFSKELRHAALQQVAQQSDKVDFRQALPKTATKYGVLFLLLVLPILATGFLVKPALMQNVLARFSNPFSDLPRFAYVRFEGLPREWIVAREEPFTIRVKLKKSSLSSPPPAASAVLRGQESQTASYQDGYSFSFSGLSEARQLTLTAGDAVVRRRVVPQPRPRLGPVEAEIKLPDYLQRPTQRISLPSGALALVDGAQGRFLLEADRPVARYGGPPEENNLPFSFEVNDRQLRSSWIKAPTSPVTTALHVTSTKGLQSASARVLSVRQTADLAPQPLLRTAQREYLLLEQESLDLTLTARDDFGLKELGILWKQSTQLETDPADFLGQKLVLNGGPTQRTLSRPFVFQPKLLGIQPQTFTLHTYALDYRTGRAPTLSAPVLIHLLSTDQHAKYVQQQLSGLIGQLEEQLEEEQQLNDQYFRLAPLGPPQLQTLEAQSELRRSTAKQREHQNTTQEYARVSQELLAEALRNDRISRLIKRQLARTSQGLRDLVEQDYRAVLDALQRSATASATPADSFQQFTTGQTAHRLLIQKLRELIEEARALNREFEASTFVARLAQLAKEESEVSRQLAGRLTQTGGLPPDQLDPRDRRELRTLEETQEDITERLGWIIEDLKHYFARTKKEEVNTLAAAIEGSTVRPELKSLRSSVERNHRYAGAKQARSLAERFSQWAQELQEAAEAKQASRSGGGKGRGPDGRSDEEIDFMLRVMEIVKKQQNVRGQTRAIEQFKKELSEQ